ncbi:MAG: hypothetical protein ABIG42_02260, partial [bacterium]
PLTHVRGSVIRSRRLGKFMLNTTCNHMVLSVSKKIPAIPTDQFFIVILINTGFMYFFRDE